MAADLYQAGLHRINISLDSLDAATFDRIIGLQGQSRWQQIWEGILAADQVGFEPLKLNVVVIPGISDSEVLDLAALIYPETMKLDSWILNLRCAMLYLLVICALRWRNY